MHHKPKRNFLNICFLLLEFRLRDLFYQLQSQSFEGAVYDVLCSMVLYKVFLKTMQNSQENTCVGVS